MDTGLFKFVRGKEFHKVVISEEWVLIEDEPTPNESPYLFPTEHYIV